MLVHILHTYYWHPRKSQNENMRRGVGIAAAKNKSLAQVTGKDNFNTIGVLKWSLVTCFVLNKMVPYYCFGLSSTYLYIARKIYLLTLRRFFLGKINRNETDFKRRFWRLFSIWKSIEIPGTYMYDIPGNSSHNFWTSSSG